MKAERRALEAYPPKFTEQKRHSKRIRSEKTDTHSSARAIYFRGYRQAGKDVAEAFARIIRGNLSGIEIGIQNMFEQLYTDITGEKCIKDIKIEL